MLSFKEFLLESEESKSEIQLGFMNFIKNNFHEVHKEDFDALETLIHLLVKYIEEKLSDNDINIISPEDVNEELITNIKQKRSSYFLNKSSSDISNIQFNGNKFAEMPVTLPGYNCYSIIKDYEFFFNISRKTPDNEDYDLELERNFIPDLFETEIFEIDSNIKTIKIETDENFSFTFGFKFNKNLISILREYFTDIKNKIWKINSLLINYSEFKGLPSLELPNLELANTFESKTKLFENHIKVEQQLELYYFHDLKILQNCETDILYLEQSSIQKIDFKTVKLNGIHLKSSTIHNLPKNLHLATLGLEKASYINLPDGLTIDKNLNISNSNITEIGNNITIKGELILNNYITKLPENLKCNKLNLTKNNAHLIIPESLEASQILIKKDNNFTIPEKFKSKIKFK